MANIKEFCGYRYNSLKNIELNKVMAPPYDTISTDETEGYYNADEFNIIRVSKGKSFCDDNETNNCYTRANDFLNEWIKKEILIREEKPVLYLYEQRIKYNETTFINHGIVSLLELCELDEGDVLTCELPSVDASNDRYNLISSIKANVDMINCMYIDAEKSLSNIENTYSEKKPDFEFTTEDRVIESMTDHRLWIIDDKKTIEFIKGVIKSKTVFITDGHNRYLTALEYKNWCVKNDKNYTKDSDCNYIMAFCANAYGNRMVQLPVHRILKGEKKFNEDYFIACAQDNFKVEKIIVDTSVDALNDVMKKQIATMRMETRFAVYCGGNYFYRLTLINKGVVKNMLQDKSSAYCSLDVTVFNKLIMEDILNISQDNIDEVLKYTKRSTNGIKEVQNKEASCLFVLNPVKAEQIREVALSGEVMPERSIYIFPKPATGVIINKFDDWHFKNKNTMKFCNKNY